MHPADFFSDPTVVVLTLYERRAYREALDLTWLSQTPGVGTENQWRCWMSYTVEEWEPIRLRFLPLFVEEDGLWVQKRVVAEFEHATQKSRKSTDAILTRYGRSTDVPQSIEVRGKRLEEEETSQHLLSDATDLPARKAPKKERPVRDVEWEEAFEEHFWPAYPKKQKKPDALKAWMSCPLREQEGLNQVFSGLEKWKVSSQWCRDNGDFIPLPATWLRAAQYDDEVEG